MCSIALCLFVCVIKVYRRINIKVIKKKCYKERESKLKGVRKQSDDARKETYKVNV